MDQPLDDRSRRLLGMAEKAAVLVLLLAALVPLLKDLGGPWDREFDGFQGTSFVLGALNFDRLGLGKYGGYMALNVDLPQDPEVLPYLYPNHPPLVPVMLWFELKALGPDGWNQNWKTGKPPPPGTERAARLPFLFGHILALLALWWCVRCVGDARTALLALALGATLPIQIIYGSLVNYENVVWPPTLLGVAFQMRYFKAERLRDLWLAGASFFAAACVTFFPAFLVPPLALQALVTRGFKSALKTGAVLSLATLTPAMAHGAWARHVLPPELSANLTDRVGRMLQPLLDGSRPFGAWLNLQVLRTEHFLTLPVLLLALAGLGVVFLRWLRQAKGKSQGRPSPGPALLCGGLLALLAFYKHTGDGTGLYDGQTLFFLALAPGAAVLAAEALGALGRPLLRLRGGEGPLVVITLGFLIPSLLRAESIRHLWRDPGPFDTPPVASGPKVPLPSTVGAQIKEILPQGAVGIYPQQLGLTPAASYYAWRTLVPATPSTYDLCLLRIKNAYGLGAAPRYILIPKNPPASAVQGTAASRAIVSERSEMIAETEDWELWPPIPGSDPELVEDQNRSIGN